MELSKARLFQATDDYTTKYPPAVEFAKQQLDIFWHPDEIAVEKDIHDMRVNLSDSEKHGVITVLKLFTMYELIAGGEYWGERVMKDFPRPDIQRMASAFSFFELNVHAPFYNKINELLGLASEEFYTEYTRDETLKSRMEFIDEYVNHEDPLTSLGVFSMVEGAVLYSSFAFLKHFQNGGKNLLVNINAGINFSVRDEHCTSKDTEILTNSGWKLISSLEDFDKVAQYDMATDEISFVKPLKIISKPHNGYLDHYVSEKRSLDFMITPDHDVVLKRAYKGASPFAKKVPSQLFNPSQYNRLPVAGYAKKDGDELSMKERFLIALQADGSIDDRAENTGSKSGYIKTVFQLTKERKKERLLDICDQCGYDVYIGDVKGNEDAKRIRVSVPLSEVLHKDFSWVDISKVSSIWASQFIEECLLWDGHVNKQTSQRLYCNTDKSCIDVVQALACLSGQYTYCRKSIDDRKDSYKDYYRLSIKDNLYDGYISSNSVKKESVKYNDMVYCVTVPTGAIVTRRNDRVVITGNCHSQGGAWLYRELKSELNLDKRSIKPLEKRIINAAHKVLEHEERIVDMIFEKGRIKGITELQMKNFVKSRINLCLQNLEIDPIFDVDYNPIADWFYKNIGGDKIHDFFHGVGSSYNRDWEEKSFCWHCPEVDLEDQ